MSKIYENITELIGQTPIIKLRNLPEDSAEVYVKLEAFNPGGSVKDRIALNMIRQAERDGLLLNQLLEILESDLLLSELL